MCLILNLFLIIFINVVNNSNDDNFYGNVFVNSLETNSNNSNYNQTGISTKTDGKQSVLLLIIYLLTLGVSIIVYYMNTGRMTDIQRFLVLLIAGLSNVLTGIILFGVKEGKQFKQIEGLLILVQPLMGLKGNLEMTMASRMSTLMNIRGHLISFEDICKEIGIDLILVQSQATVISLFTAIFVTIEVMIASYDKFSANNSLILCAISLLTANTASFLLGIVISLIIVCLKKIEHDPDDFATPVAASLGDLVTLLVMIFFVYILSRGLFYADFSIESLVVIIIIMLVEVILVTITYRNKKTRSVLLYGWTPIIISSIISLISGIVFYYSNKRYRKLATFQPLFNGFAGNCLALLSSRISTSLHRMGDIGTIDSNFSTCVTPYYAYCSNDNKNARTTTLLLLMVIPAQILYILIIDLLQTSDDFQITFLFVAIYLTFCLLPISILLYFGYILTNIVWILKHDPDSYAIPILTAIADFIGTLSLFLTFILLELFGDVNAVNSR